MPNKFWVSPMKDCFEMSCIKLAVLGRGVALLVCLWGSPALAPGEMPSYMVVVEWWGGGVGVPNHPLAALLWYKWI